MTGNSGVDSLEGNNSKFELPIFYKEGWDLTYSVYTQLSNNEHSRKSTQL